MLHLQSILLVQISVHFDATSVVDFKTAANGDNGSKFFHGLLQEGIYTAPSAYEVVYY
jgi:glutamate-1-semialdehyde 2,1-aminomutase